MRARRRQRRRAPAPGSGSGSGSLPGPVLFEPGLTGMGHADHTRSAIRIRTAPRNGCQPTAAEVGRLLRLKRTVATVQIEPLQLTGWVRTLLFLPLTERYK